MSGKVHNLVTEEPDECENLTSGPEPAGGATTPPTGTVSATRHTNPYRRAFSSKKQRI